MEVIRIITLFLLVVLIFIAKLVNNNKYFIYTSVVIYIFLILLNFYQFHIDYNDALDMYVLIEEGVMNEVPNIVKYQNINHIFFMTYSFIYILILFFRIKK